MKSILLLICTLVLTLSFTRVDDAYSFDKKTGVVSENGKALFTILNVGPKGEGEFSVKNMDGKELIFLKTSDFKDEKEVSSANPSGNIVFTTFIFHNSSSIAEIEGATFGKHWAKVIYENKLIVNGELDSDAEERFIKIKGNDFSKRRDAGSNKVIIINNNNPAPKNGVNIQIGN